MTTKRTVRKPTDPVYRWEGQRVTIVRKVGKHSVIRLPNSVQFTVLNRELKKEI